MSSLRLVAWAEPGQEPLVRDAVRHAGATLVAVGCSGPGANQLAAALRVPVVDDLRSALRRDGVDAIWLAEPTLLSPDDRRLVRRGGVKVISSHPQLATRDDLPAAAIDLSAIEFAPLMRRGPGFRAASQALAAFGPVRCVHAEFRCGPDGGTLWARLFDAADLTHGLCGPPETVHASMVGPTRTVPDSPAALRGHLVASARCADDRCFSLCLSDQAGAWSRNVTVLGPCGCMEIDDGGFTWYQLDGQVADRHREPAPLTAAALIAQQLQRSHDGLDATEAPPDALAALTLAEAIRLSGRTGQAETVQRLLEMLSRP